MIKTYDPEYMKPVLSILYRSGIPNTECAHKAADPISFTNANLGQSGYDNQATAMSCLERALFYVSQNSSGRNGKTMAKRFSVTARHLVGFNSTYVLGIYGNVLERHA